MPLLVVGISHKTAPLSVLERFALNAQQSEQMLEERAAYTDQSVILATCNRTEIYTAAQQTEIGAQHLHRFLAQWADVPWEDVHPYLYAHTQWDAVQHLFNVTAGLDSMVVGEEQILGQVRSAMEQAKAKGTLDATLSKAFLQAIRVGRRARSETNISRSAISVSSLAVGLAKTHFGSLDDVNVLLISAGEAGKLASRSLVGQGVRHLEVTNRSHDRAQALAERTGGVAVPFETLDAALVKADLVITATSAPEYLLSLPQIARVVARRGDRPLVFVDIAMPRDVDPDVTKLPNVSLYNIEDIQAYVERNLLLRSQETGKAQAIIDDELQRFKNWWDVQSVRPTIAALRRKADDIREQELRKTLRKFPSLSDAERAGIEAMTKAFAKKLLHDPFNYLKERRDGEDSVAMIQAVFGLDAASGTASPPVVSNGHHDEPLDALEDDPRDTAATGSRYT